jgi:hypothetical protein
VTRRSTRRWWAALLFLWASLLVPHARAHSIDSATLTLTEVAEGKFTVDWQSTAKTLKELREPARYPKSCQTRGDLLDCGPLGLAGTIEFPWLESSEARVIVLIVGSAARACFGSSTAVHRASACTGSRPRRGSDF